MSKAEKFISNCTRNCSNEISGWNDGDYMQIYRQWVTPDEARKAVEIAMEEMIEWLRINLCNYFDTPRSMFEMCLDELKKRNKR